MAITATLVGVLAVLWITRREMAGILGCIGFMIRFTLAAFILVVLAAVLLAALV